jgi:hypothetical protein
MFADVFSDLAVAFSGAFEGPFYDAKVKYAGVPAYDAGGSITGRTGASERVCQAQVDLTTEAMRRSENYQDGDMRIYILTSTLAGALDTDMTISILGGPHIGNWMIASVGTDPVGIGWECLGRRL